MMQTKAAKLAFAARMAELRDKCGLTQEQLGRSIGVSQTCVWNWERGRTFPRGPSLRKLAQTLETSSEFLESGAGIVGASNRPGDAGHTPPALGDVILQAKKQIAAAAGAQVSQVRILIDWGE